MTGRVRRRVARWAAEHEVHAFAIDERARRETAQPWAHRSPFYWRGFLNLNLPAPVLCRAFGHRPVVDGYGKAGETDHRGSLRANRWVECGRCEARPTGGQGHLDPAAWPTLGAPYTGPFLDPLDAEILQRAYRDPQQAQTLRDVYVAPGPWGDVRRVELSCEVHVEPVARWLSRCEFGGKVGWGGSRESTVSVDVHAGPLSVYLRESRLFGMRFARRVDFMWSPEVSVRLQRFDGRTTLRWSLWSDPSGDMRRRGSSEYKKRRTGPYGTSLRLREGYIDPVDLVLGRPEVSEHVLGEARGDVALPEGVYPATVTLHRYIRRDRLRCRTHYRVDVKPDRPIPVPGNLDSDFYDGDDATHAMSTGYRGSLDEKAWLTYGLVEMARSVLGDRTRHGGSPAWQPEPAQSG